MHTTQLTMLRLAGENETEAWSVLDRLYRPLVAAWMQSQIGNAADVDDLTQDVFATVVRELPTFEHSGRRGAFRKWLKSICLHRLMGYRRRLAIRGEAVGGSDFQERLQDVPGLEDAEARWDAEHDQLLLKFLFQRVSLEFEEQTLAIFRRLTLDGASVADVSREFSVSPGSVYVARSRVLRKMREEAVVILGEDLDASIADTRLTPGDTNR